MKSSNLDRDGHFTQFFSKKTKNIPIVDVVEFENFKRLSFVRRVILRLQNHLTQYLFDD